MERQKLSSLPSELISQECTSFLDRLHEAVEGSGILSHVHCIRDLCHIRKSVYEYMKDTSDTTEWDSLCDSVLGKRINLWEEFFRGIFRDRLETLIANKVDGAVGTLEESAKTAKSEPISEFIWAEGPPQDVFSKTSGNFTPLGLKTKGFSPKIVSVCSGVDQDFEALFQEVTLYLGEEKAGAKLQKFVCLYPEDENLNSPEPFSLSQDAQAMWEYTTKCIQSRVTTMVENLAECSTMDFLHATRLCTAAPLLTPALKKCTLRSAQKSGEDAAAGSDWMMTSQKVSEEDWNRVEALLEGEATRTFVAWVDKFPIGSATQTLESVLVWSDDRVMMEQVLSPAWDQVEISEEGEEGQAVTSTIRVPAQTSLGLSKALADVCSAMLDAGIHAASAGVQESVCHRALEALTNTYARCLKRDEKLSQNVALQLLFDVEFLSNLKQQGLLSAEEVEEESFSARLEEHIDPFDMSVFRPYLTANVRRCVMRHQTLLSPVISSSKNALLTSTRGAVAAPGGGGGQFTNALVVSESTARFPLLPIVVPTNLVGGQVSVAQRAASMVNSSLVDTSHQQSQHSLKVPSQAKAGGGGGSRKRDKSPVTKAAGSFFEAMSSSWFGSMK